MFIRLTDRIRLAVRMLRGNPAAHLKTVCFQAVLLALVLLSVCTAWNLNGTIENDLIQSVERRTVLFSAPPSVDEKQVAAYPFVRSVEREGDKLVVVLRSVGDKQAAEDALNQLDCWEYIDPSAEEDHSALYQTAANALNGIAGLISVFTLFLFVLFLYRSIRMESKQLAVLRAIGFRQSQICLLTVIEQSILYAASCLLSWVLMEIVRAAFLEKLLASVFRLSTARLQTPASAVGMLFALYFLALLLGCLGSTLRFRNSASSILMGE